MDQEEHLKEKSQTKFLTRSTTRHLRRKRLKEARRAEREQACLTNGLNVETIQQVPVKDPPHTEVITKSKARRLRKKNREELLQSCCSCDHIQDYDLEKAVCQVKYDEKTEQIESKSQNIESEQDLSELSCSSGSSDLLRLGNDVQAQRTQYEKNTEQMISMSRLNQKIEETIREARIKRAKENIQLGRLEKKSFSKLEKHLSFFHELTKNIQMPEAECDKQLKYFLSEISLTEVIENGPFILELNNETELELPSELRIKSDALPTLSEQSQESVKTLNINDNPVVTTKASLQKVIDVPSNISKSQASITQTINNIETTEVASLDSNLCPSLVHDSSSNLNWSQKLEMPEVTDVVSSSVQSCTTQSDSTNLPTTIEIDNSVATSLSQTVTINEMTDNKISVPEKTREEIKAEREAKKAAKAAAKVKAKTTKTHDKQSTNNATDSSKSIKTGANLEVVNYENVQVASETRAVHEIPNIAAKATVGDVKCEGKSKAEMRAERRAKQEAQRAAKQQQMSEKNKVKSKEADTVPVIPVCVELTKKNVMTKKVIKKENTHEVNLFKHLYHERELAFVDEPSVNSNIHPAIVRLGAQYASKVIVGSNARCVALLAAVKQLIQDFERPSQADFIRGFEAKLQESVAYLHYCRPLAVSMQNALRHLKWQMTQLPSTLSDMEAKSKLGNAIDTYILEQIQLADKAISITIQTKISNGNVILTYGYSSLIHKILLDAHTAGKKFRVIVVDGRPWLEGKEQLRRLAKHGIECSYILINALSFVMPEVSKVFLGAHAILANGAVMSRVGTAQVALMARAFNVPVLVACETHKSCERVQTDSIVYNELGDADELAQNHGSTVKKSLLSNWKTKKSLNLLNLTYDVTPADLVTAVVTELAILPCTSVPVILRIKPSEI